MRNNHAYYEDPVDFYAQRENVISWTSKISGLVRKNQPNEAVGLFKKMLENEERPNFVTVLSVILKENIDGKYIGFKTTPIVVILVKYIY